MSTPAGMGRAVPAPQTYTFPNGQRATLRLLSQFTLAKLQASAQRRLPRPPAPMAPGPFGEDAPNESDPDYQERVLPEWRGAQGLLINDLILEAAVDIDVDRAALDEVRAVLASLDEPLDEISDKVAYIKHVAFAGAGSAEQFRDRLLELLGRITGAAAPTEADVQAHVETFRRDVGGPAAAETASAALEGALQPAV